MVRPLGEEQYTLVDAMIRHATGLEGEEFSPSVRAQWASYLPRLAYGGRCECGQCPSFSLTLEGALVPESADRVMLSASSSQALVMLFIDDGVPSYLEVAPMSDDVVEELPSVEQLTIT